MPLTSVTDLPALIRATLGRGAGSDAASWAILDLNGAYPTHHTNDITALLQHTESFQAFTDRLDQLGRTESISGVLVRVVELTAGLATSEAIGRALGRLARSKRVVVYLPQVNMRSLLVAAEVSEVVAPESAEVMLSGFAAERVYYGEFLTRRGIGFENLRIREYKSALNRFSDDHMDDHEREQLTTYLDSAEQSWLGSVSPAANLDALLGADFTNAQQLLDAGLITRIGWDDESRCRSTKIDQIAGTRLRPDRRAAARKKVPGRRGAGRRGDRLGTQPPSVRTVHGLTAGSETVVAATPGRARPVGQGDRVVWIPAAARRSSSRAARCPNRLWR